MLNRVASLPVISNFCAYASDRKVAHKNWSNLTYSARARFIASDIKWSSFILAILSTTVWLAIVLSTPNALKDGMIVKLSPLLGISGALGAIALLSTLGLVCSHCCSREKKIDDKPRHDTL